MTDKKHYKNIHITSEFGLRIFGGIGSLLKVLYENKNEDDLFIAFNLTEEECEVVDSENVVYILPEEFEEDFILKHDGENIIFHNYLVGEYFIKNCKNIKDYKLYNVVHSNPIYEGLFYKTTTRDDMILSFKYALENLDGLIFITDYEKDLFMKLKNQFNLEVKEDIEYLTIYNGFNVSEEEFKLRDESENTNIYGFIGRLDTRKGLIELLPHFKNIPDKKLYIATGGAGKFDMPMYWEFIQSFNENNINGNLMPLGFIQQQRKKLFFETIDVLIIPSLYEPFGLVLLEALANNKPVFCNKTGGLLEILGDDFPFFFDVFDEDELKRVVELYESMSREEIEKIFNDLKDKIRNKYSAEQMVEGYRSI